MRLYHPDHRGVTPYNELVELDYRDPEFIVVLKSPICIVPRLLPCPNACA